MPAIVSVLVFAVMFVWWHGVLGKYHAILGCIVLWFVVPWCSVVYPAI